MIATREILWNVWPPLVTALYVAATAAGAWIALWFFRRSRLWARGVRTPARIDLKAGVARLVDYLVRQRTIRRDPYAGRMHLLIFWGFAIELAATTLVAVQHHFHIVFLTGNFYRIFSLVSDIGGVALLVGLGMALWRRRKPSRLRRTSSITLMLVLLFAVTASGFIVEAARIATTFPAFERWSVFGYPIAATFASLGLEGGTAQQLHAGAWMAHAALAIIFFGIVPVSLMRHVILGAYTVARPGGVTGTLPVTDERIPLPVTLANFRARDWLQVDACLTCGRCAEVCPAQAAGKPLSPRSVVLGLRAHLDAPGGSIFSHVGDAALWSCTSCGACDTACPVDINIVDKIATLRRARVMEGEMPAPAAASLESAAQRGNPFGRPASARMEWASGLSVPVAKENEPVELLYWVGCAGAFDPAGKEVTRAMVRILGRLGIAYKVLGCGERCSGDPARRLGEEGLWRDLAGANQKSFAQHRVQTILTQCPHCFNAFQNEYPALGPTPRVLHHSQWLRDQIDSGKLTIAKKSGETITFHDPCYLARANGEIEAPRAILDGLSTSPRVEMAAHGKKSFCCGGGGGQMWLDVRGETRVETIRAGHAEATGAQTVATGCPFCRVMVEAGRTTLPEGEGKWRVRDIAELVAENLE